MLLIHALVMVAQEYSEAQGWLIQSPHGRITKAPAPLSAHYMAYDERGTFIRGNMALEIVLAALIERNPAADRDEHWKISPYTPEESDLT